MKAVIKKRVLFNFLKKALNESRSDYTFYSDGSFLGRFEEEEEQSGHIDSDVPLRANPSASFQLHADNFDVSDPEFLPSSKPGLISAAAAILDHVPDRQIEFAYEEMHRLLDRVMEKEDQINYGALSEALGRIIHESSRSRSEELFQIAADKYAKGDSGYLQLIDDIVDVTPDMTRDDIEDKIADMATTIMMQASQPAAAQAADPEPEKINVRSSSGQKMVIRRKKKPEVLQAVPSEYEVEDLSFNDKSDYEKAQDKPAFMKGYNSGADDAANDIPAEDVSEFGPDFAKGYELGYAELDGPDQMPSGMLSDLDDEDASLSQPRSSQRAQFSENVPHVLRLVPEFYMLCQDIGYKLDGDKYNLMMTGDDPKTADKNIRQVYNIPHTATFIDHNLLKSYFTKDFALESAAQHFDVIMDRRFESPDATEFVSGFIDAIAADGYTEAQGKNLLIKVFVAKILVDVAKYDYEADRDKRAKTFLRNLFAELTVYKTGTAAGPGGTQKASAKPYQGNTSATFYRRVKEEFRQDIVTDFITKLRTGNTFREEVVITNEAGEETYRGPGYKVPSGLKTGGRFGQADDDSLKFHIYKDEELEMKALDIANDTIDQALSDQAAAEKGKVITPEDEIEDEAILGDEESPKGMSDEEIAEKLSNTRDFQTLAPFFGFSGAPGMRQWFLKFAKRFFEMGIISAKTGDRTLLDFHSEMVEAVLETLSEKLPDLMMDLAKEDDGSAKYQEMMSVFQRVAPQIEDAFQEFLDVGDDLHDITVSGQQEAGSSVQMPFLDTLGGQLARAVNGMFFKKVLTKLDKAWTDYVADQLQENEQFKNYIADSIAQSANIDAKAAKSLAEYFIGKKNAPVILTNKGGTERVYKSEAEGNPTKGVRALLKYGIDANAYHIIDQESKDYFEDMLMTDFARIVDFEGQYRTMILKDYEKIKKNDKAFRKVILQALEDVIVGSSERMAMANLSDYEVVQ